MYATNILETMILNTFRGQAATAPATLKLGLFLTSPGEAGGGTEVSYAGYQRQTIVFSEPAVTDGGMEIHNSAEITFPTPAVNVGTIQFFGVFDAATGNCLLYSPVTNPAETRSGEAPVIIAGEAQWVLTEDFTQSWKTKVLNLMRGVSIAGFTPYLAMYNGSPDESGTELSGNGYARPQVGFGAPAEQSGGAMQIANSAQVDFNRSNAAWGIWDNTAVCDASESGNVVFFKSRTSKEMRKGIRASVAAGDLTLAVN